MRGLDVIEDVIGLGDFLERLKPVMCLAALRMTARNSGIITARAFKPCRANFTHKIVGSWYVYFVPLPRTAIRLEICDQAKRDTSDR